MQFITLATLVSGLLSLPQAQEYQIKPAKQQLPFKGITYSPYLPGSCSSAQKVASDIKNIAQYTNEIRLYGADCDQIKYVFDAIISQKLDIQVMLGAWTRDGPNRFPQELATITKLLSNPGYRALVSHISIGNEDLSNGIPISTVHSNLLAAKSSLQKYNVTLGTVEIGSNLIPADPATQAQINALIGDCDFVGINIHPYFNNFLPSALTSQQAVPSIRDYIEKLAKKFPQKKLIITETGFPTVGDASKDYGQCSPQAQFKFLKAIRCEFQKQGDFQYFAFEAYDAKFKNDYSRGGIERNFGIFKPDGSLKSGSVESLYQC